VNADLLLEAANDELWRNVPSESCRLAKAASSIAAVIRNIAPDLPDPERVTVWYSPDDEAALFHGVSGEKAAEWANMLTGVPVL